jgi:hypothetical protein
VTEKEKNKAQDFKEAFATDEGIRTLSHLSEKCREHKATYTLDNALHTAYLEGMRSVIIYIRAQLGKDLGKKEQKEAQNDRGS